MHLPEPDRARFVDLNRTTLRLWEWGDPTDPAVICAHGAYDHGRMFDEVAPRLAARGLHVVAPDLQGHGDSGRLSSGHVWSVSALDLALLARELGDPVGLVGHSFGGGQALYTAAIWPELVRWVVNIDGLGPSPEGFDDAARLVEAVTAGFDAAQRVRANPIRIYDSLASMANRRRRINVRLPEPWLEHLTRHGATPAGDGGWSWKADPMFNVGFVGAFDEEALLVQYRLVERPTLVLTGTEPDAWSDLSADDIGPVSYTHLT
ncbi:MAG: alpha/beta fold hydrolase, partial [Acidimicrobiia bacterium]|nr:alpha/beta fold hydrolase [Acidimicrobiia bacterium]